MKEKRLSVIKKSSAEPRFYVVIPKKVSSLATKRNLFKRKLRAAAREIFGRHGAKETFVVYAKKDDLRKPYKELLLELKKAINKL